MQIHHVLVMIERPEIGLHSQRSEHTRAPPVERAWGWNSGLRGAGGGAEMGPMPGSGALVVLLGARLSGVRNNCSRTAAASASFAATNADRVELRCCGQPTSAVRVGVRLISGVFQGEADQGLPCSSGRHVMM